MKILMLGDCAYVSYELTRELRSRGHEVDHITFDHASRLRYLTASYAPLKAEFGDYDLVHAHYLRFPAYVAFFSGKPFIVHCHGSDLRRYRLGWLKRQCLKKAAKVLVSTEDLLKFCPDAVWLPNPVGREFYDRGKSRNGAVYFPHRDDPPLLPEHIARLKPDVIERHVPYEVMPVLLNKYRFLVSSSYPFLQKLMLEGLACGCQVVPWNNGSRITEFPPEHYVDKVTDQLLDIYEEILKK